MMPPSRIGCPYAQFAMVSPLPRPLHNRHRRDFFCIAARFLLCERALEPKIKKIRGFQGMIVGALVGLSLAVNVSIDRGAIDGMTGFAAEPHYTEAQKNAAVRPLMKSGPNASRTKSRPIRA